MARDLTVRLLGDEKDLKRAFGDSGKDADKFGKRLSGGVAGGLGKVAKGGLLAGGVLAGGLAAGLGFAAKAAIEAEKSQARLDATLAAMGKNTPAVRGQIDQMVGSVSKLGAFDDEDLTDAFSTLAKTTGSTEKALAQLPLVADVARGANISLATATKLVGKAATGQTGALKKYGIVLEDGATATDALAALQGKFAGQAEAYGKTTAGSMERAHIAVENLGEKVGTALAPAIAFLAEKGVEFIERFGPDIEAALNAVIEWITVNWPTIKAVILQVFDAIQAAWEDVGRPIFDALMTVTETLVGWIRDHWAEIQAVIDSALKVIKGIVDVFVGVLTGDWGRAWDGIKAIVVGTIEGIVARIQLAWEIIKSVMGTLGAKAIEGLKTVLAALPGVVWDLVNAGLLKIGELEVAAFNAAKGLGGRVLGGIKGGIGDLAGMIGDKLGDLWQGIVNAGKAAFELAKGLGGQILGGIKDGIGDLGGWIIDQVRGAINWVFDQITGRVNSALEFSFDTHIPGVGDVSVDPPNIAIPHLADGGIVLPRPGGTLVRAGEGGVAEAVIPLDGRAGGITVVNNFHGTLADQPQAAAAAMSFALRGIA